MEVVITTLLSLVFTIMSNVIIFVIYKLKSPFFERYKISAEPWPWIQNPEKFNEDFKKALKVLLINKILIIPIIPLIGLVFEISAFRTSVLEYPTSAELIIQIIFFMVVEDTSTYWLHRMFHTPWLYKNFHKKHHEYIDTIGITSEYFHPFEYLFSSTFCSCLGAGLIGSRCHIFTLYMWGFIRILENTDGHCGYEFS